MVKGNNFAENKKGYNQLASTYYQFRKEGKQFHNEYLDMPVTLKLLGSVKGKKVLDLGCGPGFYSRILAKRGARVKGMDMSEEELKIARQLSPKIEFITGNAEKLPYKSGEFDIVLAALVLEHFDDWNKLLREVNRVLKKGGYFVFSAGNPVGNCIRLRKEGIKLRNYFKEEKITSNWWNGVRMSWYPKTYGHTIRLLMTNGFELADYEDAFPLKKAEKLFPKQYKFTSTVPYFCTWKWRKK